MKTNRFLRFCAFIVVLTLLTAGLTGCKQGILPSGESTTSESQAISSSSETSDTTASIPQSQTSEPVRSETNAEKKLNTDIFSDIGLTYEQLVAKRGKLVDFVYYAGGYSYVFENGLGEYGLSYDDSEFVPERDEHGNIILEKVPVPKSDVKCYDIVRVKANTIFQGITFPTTVSEIEKNFGVKCTGEGMRGGESPEFGATFTYNNGYEFCLFTNKLVEHYGKGVLWYETDRIEDVIKNVPILWNYIVEIQFFKDGIQIYEGEVEKATAVRIIYANGKHENRSFDSVEEIYSSRIHHDQLIFEPNADIDILLVDSQRFQ